MDIGTKIKNARLAAKLTQEQAAEGRGVIRHGPVIIGLN